MCHSTREQYTAHQFTKIDMPEDSRVVLTVYTSNVTMWEDGTIQP
jgi:hypothetical protein